MGKITINFIHLGESVNNPKDFKMMSKIQNIEIQNNIDHVRELDIKSEISISIDISEAEDGIEWKNYLEDKQLVSLLEEIKIYKQASLKLDKILNEFRYLGFDDRYKIEKLGKEASNIVESLPDSNFSENLNISMSIFLEHINHTLNKEVSMLYSARSKESKKRKDAYVKDAITHLDDDIAVINFRLKRPFDLDKTFL